MIILVNKENTRRMLLEEYVSSGIVLFSKTSKRQHQAIVFKTIKSSNNNNKTLKKCGT